MPSCPSIISSASYVFDAVDADVVLLSSEPIQPVEFRVHKCILALASPFFRDMFTLPQAPSQDVSQKAVPVIPVSETKDVLEPLLRFVYPIPDPTLHSLDELEPVLAAAVKYEFDAVAASLRAFLISSPFLHASPVEVYAIACRYGLMDEAKIASRHTLGVDLLKLEGIATDSLKSMVAIDYHRLLVLHKRRSEAAIEFIGKLGEKDDSVDGCGGLIKCMQCNGSVFTAQGPPKWWIEWERRATEELKKRPTTEVVFGLDFLYGAARKGGCIRCLGSVLESWKVLRDLKEVIDSLPSTT